MFAMDELKTPLGQDCCDSFCPTLQAEELRGRLGEVTGLSEIFKVLGDETRTKILYLLSLKKLCVCDLAVILGMSLPAISHHLRLLKTLRLVKYNREGKMVFYCLDDEHIVNLIHQAQQHFAEGN
jgi:ArsR family transcriptional regulator, lead/cadmium/zinc/bismuth-responsive transcriptional repressor